MEQLKTRIWQRLLITAFRSRSFRYAFFDYQTSIRSSQAPRLFVDPFECIGAAVTTDATYYEDQAIRALKGFISNRYGGAELFYMDIGANIGNHLVALSDVYSRAIAFEPVAFNYYCCKANLLYNGIDTVILHRVALGSSEQSCVTLAVPDRSPWGRGAKRNNGMFAFTQEEEPSGRSASAPLHKADRYLEDISAFSTALVKIDCEGAELAVLRGMRAFLAGSCDQNILLAIELLSKEQAQEIHQFLQLVRPVELYADLHGEYQALADVEQLPIPSSMALLVLPCCSSGF